MKLVALAGPDAGREFAIPGPQATIGRSASNVVVLNDDNVSRRHAELQQTSGGFVIVDLNSKNGTFVNGAGISGSQALRAGDQIQMGSTVLCLQEGGSYASAEAAADYGPVPVQRDMLPLIVGGAAVLVLLAALVLGANRGAGTAGQPTATPPPAATLPSFTTAPAMATSTPLPGRPVTPTTASAASTPTPVLCPNADVRITAPAAGAQVSGPVSVYGTAAHANFAFYKLEWGSGAAPVAWSAIGPLVYSAARDAQLGVWDTTPLAEGVYTLRLTVVDKTGNFPPPCEARVSIKK